jgi:hypothetical protein
LATPLLPGVPEGRLVPKSRLFCEDLGFCWHLIINPNRQDVPAGGRNICFRNPFMHYQFVMKAVNDVRLSRAPSMLTRNSPTLRVRKSQTVAFFRSDSFSEVKSTSMCLAVGYNV